MTTTQTTALPALVSTRPARASDRKARATHKLSERQGGDVLTGCGLVLAAGTYSEWDTVEYPTCARCARKV